MSQMISFTDHEALLGVVKAQEYARGMLDMRNKLEAAGLVHTDALDIVSQELLAAIHGDPKAALLALTQAAQILLPIVSVPIPAVVTPALQVLISALSR